MDKWRHLTDLLEKKRKILHGFNDLLTMFREIESIGVEMKEMEVSCMIFSLVTYSFIHFIHLLLHHEGSTVKKPN